MHRTTNRRSARWRSGSGGRPLGAHSPSSVAITADIVALINWLAAQIRKRPADAELLAIRIKALCRLKAWAEKS